MDKLIEISLVKKEDFDSIIKLTKIIGKSSKYLSYGQEGMSYEKLERDFEDENMCFFKLTQNVMIGIYQVYVNDKVGEISLELTEEYQSKGIGTDIMKDIFKLAKSINLNELKLTAYKENIKAIKLYKKFNFKITKENKKIQEMSLKNLVINIDDNLRLVRYDWNIEDTIKWYQDEELVYLVDGKKEKYTIENLKSMYKYLGQNGELYLIEYKKDDAFIAIGDVTFSKSDIPIVIGDKEYRSKGIGKKVISKIIEISRELGWKDLNISDIFDYNIASIKCFESLGFKKNKKTEKGHSYNLKL